MSPRYETRSVRSLSVTRGSLNTAGSVLIVNRNDSAGCIYELTITSVRFLGAGNSVEITGTLPYLGFPAVRAKLWRRRNDGSWWCGIDQNHLAELDS